MTDRRVVVVDTETSGLGNNAAILEVAAIDLDSGKELHFAPFVHPALMAEADPEALAINRYYERRLFANMLDEFETRLRYRELADMLQGNTFAGCNPAFDAGLIRRAQAAENPLRGGCAKPMGAVWHHRLADLSAYAAGALGLPPGELPGLARVCELLLIKNEGEHSALGDARATAACFHGLRSWPRTQRTWA